jgi:hypothetical protein
MMHSVTFSEMDTSVARPIYKVVRLPFSFAYIACARKRKCAIVEAAWNYAEVKKYIDTGFDTIGDVTDTLGYNFFAVSDMNTKTVSLFHVENLPCFKLRSSLKMTIANV